MNTGRISYYTMTAMLSILCLLNTFWTILIVRVGLKKSQNKGFVVDFEGEKAEKGAVEKRDMKLSNGNGEHKVNGKKLK